MTCAHCEKKTLHTKAEHIDATGFGGGGIENDEDPAVRRGLKAENARLNAINADLLSVCRWFAALADGHGRLTMIHIAAVARAALKEVAR